MFLLSLVTALAGQIVVDGKVPMAVSMDGSMVAQTVVPARVSFEAPDGIRSLTITIGGNPKKIDVRVEDGTPALVLVGRSGISVGAMVDVGGESATAPEVRFRVAGNVRLMVQIGRQRVVVGPGDGLVLPLELGRHEMSVRNQDGTAVYARGSLEVTPGGEPVIVQLAQGALPETSSGSVRFYPDRS